MPNPKIAVVLVHGAWAECASWTAVILPLQKQGFGVGCAPIPLTTLSDDVAALDRVLARIGGDVVLVGHAYAGAVIGATKNERVKLLVYVAALAPDACDLTQQTFSLWASKGHLLRDGSKVKSWLFTTLYHLFISHRRHEMRWPKEEFSEVKHELPYPIPETVDHLEPRQVMKCLQSLAETFRAPLVLFYLQEHSYKEIADILAIPIGTVMSRLSRGKQKLQQAFLDRKALEKSYVPPCLNLNRLL